MYPRFWGRHIVCHSDCNPFWVDLVRLVCAGLLYGMVIATSPLTSLLCSVIWSREVVAKEQFFDSKDVMLLNKCIIETGISQHIPDVCDADVEFSCKESYVTRCQIPNTCVLLYSKHDRPDNDTYSICGVAPSCLCINSAVSDFILGMQWTCLFVFYDQALPS